MVAGGSPAAGYFLLLRQKKVPKEKATPVYRPCGVPEKNRNQAGLRNSHCVLRQSSPKPPHDCDFFRRRTGEGKSTAKTNSSVRVAHTQTKRQNSMGTLCPYTNSAFELIFEFRFSSPVPPPSSGVWSGVVGEDCLSTWLRSRSCEFRSRLARRATQGTSKRWRIGVAFF